MPSVPPRRLHSPGAAARLFDEVSALAGGLALMGPQAVTRVAQGSAPARPAELVEARGLHAKGYARLGGLCERTACSDMVTMIARLRDAGLPAVFVLATDAALALGQLVQQVVSVCSSEAYTLVEDVWAWQIPRGRSGWPAHRGISTLLDRARPELVNTWIALSDVPVERSCMHFVPLDEDAGYPDDLATIAAPAGGDATALAAGEALAWNANVLHWGGPCALECAGPRVSCAFSLVRTDALPAIGLAPLTASLTPTERVDLVAKQIATYGAGQHDVSDEILEWARATFTLSALSPTAPGGVRKER